MTPPNPRWCADRLQLGVGVLAARLLEPALGLNGLLETSRWLSGVCFFSSAQTPEASAALLTRAEHAVRSASRLVPGGRCLHQAWALKLWLARRGVHGRIEVGFRKREQLEAHAWLRVETPRGPRFLLGGEDRGFKTVLRAP